MEKEKKIKVKKKIDWKHEMALAPGYIIVILWVAFTFMLLGWIIAASLSTTTDIFAGKALKFPSGLHFENYVQAWGSGGVATFFTNSLLYAVVSCVLLILICAPAAYVLARYTFIGNKIIQPALEGMSGFKNNACQKIAFYVIHLQNFFAKIIYSIIITLKRDNNQIRCDRSSSCNIMKFIRFMKSNFTFVKNKLLITAGHFNFSFIYTDKFPKIVAFPFE